MTYITTRKEQGYPLSDVDAESLLRQAATVATTIAMLEHAKSLCVHPPFEAVHPPFEAVHPPFEAVHPPFEAVHPSAAPPFVDTKKNARALTTDEESATRPVKKVKRTSTPSNTPTVKVNDLFTSYVGSDSYGYIVTSVTDGGKTVHGQEYSSEAGPCGSTICITWRSRAAAGRGCWVELGEKYGRRRGVRYGFGQAVHYQDPCF